MDFVVALGFANMIRAAEGWAVNESQPKLRLSAQGRKYATDPTKSHGDHEDADADNALVVIRPLAGQRI